jgi:hypothetical protein
VSDEHEGRSAGARTSPAPSAAQYAVALGIVALAAVACAFF